MIKYFCDECGVELDDRNQCAGGFESSDRLGTEIKFRDPVTRETRTLKVELIHKFDDGYNAGIFCKYCILDAFLRLDDRPKAAN